MDYPTCNRSFSSSGGMRQHHAKVHGSRLPNRTCAGCSREFYDEKARRKYCEECDPNAGQNNGNWKDAKKRGTCRTCNTVFSYYPSNKEGVYCSDCVSSSDGLLPENPSKPIERIRTACPTARQNLRFSDRGYIDSAEGSSVTWTVTASGSRKTSLVRPSPVERGHDRLRSELVADPPAISGT